MSPIRLSAFTRAFVLSLAAGAGLTACGTGAGVGAGAAANVGASAGTGAPVGGGNAARADAPPSARMSGGRASNARISGVIMHPAQAVPPMRICAISDKTAPVPAPDVCIDTVAGADDYSLDGLRAGTYQIVARADRAGLSVGGHVRPVRCIRAPCPEMLAEVTLVAGERREGVDLNGFYDAREDFPAVP